MLKRLDQRREPENIVAETADRLAKMEEIFNTMSRVQMNLRMGEKRRPGQQSFSGK